MRNITLKNGKNLSNPSFFTISNFGGGGGDKFREVVYKKLTVDTPTLYNYYYLKYGNFSNQERKQLFKYKSINDFMIYVQKEFFKKEFFYKKFQETDLIHNFKEITLLDSGSRNIINDRAKSHKDELSLGYWINELSSIAIEYYKFAEKLKFDLVIGFDIGGKYTFKGDERTNQSIKDAIELIEKNAFTINSKLAEITLKFLKNNPDYTPSILMPIHGKSKIGLMQELDNIKRIEKELNYKFFGFAIGGIANAKNADKDWFKEEDVIPSQMKNAYLAFKSVKKVRENFPDRPIHALGAGGINNIISAVAAGATSYDSQTPGRRAYDGNKLSSEELFNNNTTFMGKFSKYLPGLLNTNLQEINYSYPYKYVNLNVVSKNVSLCGCPSCSLETLISIKDHYSNKITDPERFYYSKQILNSHAVYQHKILSEFLSNNIYDIHNLKFKNEHLNYLVNFTKKMLEE